MRFFDNITWPEGCVYNITPEGGIKAEGHARVGHQPANSPVYYEEGWCDEQGIAFFNAFFNGSESTKKSEDPEPCRPVKAVK